MVVIGVNGAGKTSVLDALAATLYCQLERSIKFDNSSYHLDNTAINRQKEYSTIELIIKYKNENKLRHAEIISDITRRDNSVFYLNPDAEFLMTLLHENYEDLQNGILPLVRYYRTGRHFSDESVVSYSVNTLSQVNKHKIYEKSAAPLINYTAILSWYLEQTNIQNQEKVNRKDLSYELPTIKAIHDGLNNFLKILEATNLANAEIGISKYSNNQVLLIQKANQTLEFAELSSGEKMIIGLVLDMAYRMSVGNPKAKNPLEVPGIVLIDELELHLHPKWQMSVLEALQTTFPNVQFIVTTHSPLVINHLHHEQLIVVNGSNVTQGTAIHETYGKDVNSIVEDLMGAYERPKVVKTMIEDIEKLLDGDVPDTAAARKALEALKQKIDPNDRAILTLDTLITVEEDDEVYQ